MRTSLFLCGLLAVAACRPGSNPATATPPPPPIPTAQPLSMKLGGKELVHRALTVNDPLAVVQVHIAPWIPTTLAFSRSLANHSVLLASNLDREDGADDPFGDVEESGSNGVIVIPHVEWTNDPQQIAVLSVSLSDGNVLPILLTSSTTEIDLQVDINVELEAKRAWWRTAPNALVPGRVQAPR